jgi:hypothetical protein
VATVVVLYPLLGRFEAWATHGQPVDRYAMYLAPLVLVTMMLAPGRIGWQAALVCSAGVAAALFAVPVTSNYIEQPALYGAQKRLFELGFSGDHLRSALVLAALKGVLVAAALIVAVMIAQLWTSQHAEIAVERSAAGGALPSPLDWVDRESNGLVALLAVDKDEPLRGSSDLYTDFFNREVKALFGVRASGPRACVISFEPRGFFARRGGPCPARWPREYVVVGGSRQVAFAGGRRLASSGGAVLVRVPPGTPRVR